MLSASHRLLLPLPPSIRCTASGPNRHAGNACSQLTRRLPARMASSMAVPAAKLSAQSAPANPSRTVSIRLARRSATLIAASLTYQQTVRWVQAVESMSYRCKLRSTTRSRFQRAFSASVSRSVFDGVGIDSVRRTFNGPSGVKSSLSRNSLATPPMRAPPTARTPAKATAPTLMLMREVPFITDDIIPSTDFFTGIVRNGIAKSISTSILLSLVWKLMNFGSR
uniref:(northern house mosquito) hypothetical protein n=2 Tax=Culex pipiens TaxID=7175 RepID=A0A8D8FE09_CULPI